jgi:hypothetical protein
MPSRSWLKPAAILIAVALFVAAVHAWRADRRDRAQIAAELASTKQLLAAADARQHDRDTQLAQTLAALAEQMRTIVTPAQILRELPKTLPLPVPIALQPSQASVGARFSPPAQAGASPVSPPATPSDTSKSDAGLPPQASSAAANSSSPAPDGAFIPRADLKPLYDFALDCQACQAKLAAAQSDLVDERQKTAALTKERDDALRIAKGGSAWRRVGRAAKWFLIGVAAGAIAAKTAH